MNDAWLQVPPTIRQCVGCLHFFVPSCTLYSKAIIQEYSYKCHIALICHSIHLWVTSDQPIFKFKPLFLQGKLYNLENQINRSIEQTLRFSFSCRRLTSKSSLFFKIFSRLSRIFLAITSSLSIVFMILSTAWLNLLTKFPWIDTSPISVNKIGLTTNRYDWKFGTETDSKLGDPPFHNKNVLLQDVSHCAKVIKSFFTKGAMIPSYQGLLVTT